ncbi:MAG: glycoside hydrolase family 44 protein [Sphingobium sp.]
MLTAAAPARDVIHIRVDTAARGYPINPLIYGVSFASADTLRDLNLTLNRAGGNSASLYNWRIDARNAGSDYYFESLAVGNGTADQFGGRFVALSRAGGAKAMVTIPLSGWTARLGRGRTPLAGFSVTKYGPQSATDPWMPDAGNGLGPKGHAITSNDPRDAAVATPVAEQEAWVRVLVEQKHSPAFYMMDNEPSLWHVTHRHVRRVGAHAQEIADKVMEASAMIKAADPDGKVVAPEEWGWGGYKDSGFDQQLHANGSDLAQSDRVRQTGGQDYLPWLLQRWKRAGHPIDVVSVHFYPQGGEYGGSKDASTPDIQRLRNRSTRLLWDRHYREESWIAQPVALIPLLRNWVDRYYWAGTPIAITEYNWGGENSMSGAVAQADIWGIFGRERLDMANRWMAPAAGTPTYLAMKLVRNYDGQGASFGDVSLPVTMPDSDSFSAFAARRKADGALTMLLVNKEPAKVASLSITFSSTLSSKRQLRTIRLANRKLETLPIRQQSAPIVALEVPPQSITMLVLEGASS